MDGNSTDDEECSISSRKSKRLEYEAALGRLILAHNEVDYRLASALERVIKRLSPDKSLIGFAQGRFEQRLRNLELFQKATPSAYPVQVDVAALTALNKIRNDVAHGHFDQHPNFDNFQIVTCNRGARKQTHRYSVAALNRASAELMKIASTLEAHEYFGDEPIVIDFDF